MADVSVTAASVLKASGATTATGTAGATITAGQAIYIDLTDSNELKPCDADVATSAVTVGIALHASLDSQPITYCKSGNINVGATLAKGEVYVASLTAGGIAPVGDILTGDYITILGIATTTTNLNLDIQVGGITQAA